MQRNNLTFPNRSFCQLVPVLIVSLMQTIFAGDYLGGLEYYYFDRQPSAKAEAMGRGSVANETDAFGCLYNPALISLNNGLCLSASIASPYYLLEDAKFSFIGITYTSKDYGSLGFCRYNYDDGLDNTATDENGNVLGSSESTESIYTLTYAYPVLLNFNIGINLSYFYHSQSIPWMVGAETTDDVVTAFPIDVGILKRIVINEDTNISHQITFGASFYNILGTEIEWDDRPDPMPQVLHLGVSYMLQLGQLNTQKLRPYQLHAQIEYQNVFNSDFYTGFKLGSEFAFYEMLFLRIGYYSETQNDYGIPDNQSSVDDLTYGFGLAVPINILFGFQFVENIKFDMLVLEQPGDYDDFYDFKDYSNYNLVINFNL
jgi:hypothetical protein